MHTRSFTNEENARRAYEEMKPALDSIIQSIPFASDADCDAKVKACANDQ